MKKFYFAVDVETTGLNYNQYGSEQKNMMLQMAFKILNDNFEVLCEDNAYFSGVEVFTLWNMDPYVFDMHCNTGLLQKLHSRDNLVSYKYFEHRILTIIDKKLNSIDDDWVLIPIGNNVQFDVEVIRRHMPKLFAQLHYSFIDVSSIRRLLTIANPVVAPTIYEIKESDHDAETDITACLKELYVYHALAEDFLLNSNSVEDAICDTEQTVCDYIKELYEQSSEMYDNKSV